MNRDSALDILAFAVGFRLMAPEVRRSLRIAVLLELGDAAPESPELAVLVDEDQLIRGEREPASHYDHAVLRRADREAARPPFDKTFWLARRADLEGAGFTAKEAVDLIASIQATLSEAGSIGKEGDHNGNFQQVA
ncbi:MAG: hypothetical protein GC147_04605 [Porphyrobacter sp.]|nr:hypothetical protein [Porphyrobacter sp.]